MNQKYFDICDKTIASLMDKDQGDIETANNTLSKLLVENTDLKMFLYSTGKYLEYSAWIKRFKEKYKGIENMIKGNLEIEEAGMYCKDCKFYKYDRTDQILDEELYRVEKEFNRGTCHNKNLRFGWELENESQLIYHDSDDYSAHMFVGEMFGCVHFKEKENIQKLLSNINRDLNILFDVVKHYKRIYEDKWINKGRYNSHQAMLMRMECDQLVYDCKMLLEEIEIHETRSK